MGPGGGMAQPPYLQGRKPMITPANGQPQIGAKAPQPMTQPMITPMASIVPGETRGPVAPVQPPKPQGNLANMATQIKKATSKPSMLSTFGKKIPAPNVTPITPAQQGATGNPLSPAGQSAYDVLKGDLEDQRRSAMSGAVADASARGVYYGTPLTTSQGDIQTQYLRGLGQLQAGVLGNEQQNEISRLQIASNLIGQNGVAQGGKIDPATLQMLGTLFAPRNGPTGPSITPAAPGTPGSQQEIDPLTGQPKQRTL